MTSTRQGNRVRERRTTLGLTQAELAERAGISRTAVTAIEGARLAPSVSAALALAATLESTVEDLFGNAAAHPKSEVWAWQPPASSSRCWRAEVGGKSVLYPAESTPTLTLLPDNRPVRSLHPGGSTAKETLVIACCDPAAGMLASQFAATTGLRMLVLPRSSRQALEMLRDGVVHLAGLHLSTGDEPDGNANLVQSTLGAGYRLARVARWQEGIAITPRAKVRSVREALKAKLTWIGREPGSGARQCLDRLLDNRPGPRRVARNHRGVVEAVRSGWADAGVCVKLVSSEAGLDFLPVQEEGYDVCFPNWLEDDRRIKAFLSVLRSSAFRRMFGDLPGYDTSETGNLREVKVSG